MLHLLSLPLQLASLSFAVLRHARYCSSLFLSLLRKHKGVRENSWIRDAVRVAAVCYVDSALVRSTSARAHF